MITHGQMVRISEAFTELFSALDMLPRSEAEPIIKTLIARLERFAKSERIADMGTIRIV